ncbi:unnamed protein product [Leptidea sinapis]|uniref:PDZ domain-containing protein n=1 Tax=Leptidea sinapis TaxID=189913 RepID=A0A5E4QBE6_9NEOP|nr:unnamed protein product [Leptidea sinapis]
MESTSTCEDAVAGIRIVVLNLPEDEGEGLGFRLTRTLWDPYPWVHDVTPGSRADAAGLKTGDCLLQAEGKDLLGMPVGQVAGMIRGDGASHGVSLMVWNCGVDPSDDPELLWSCGGGARGERARRALSGVVKALACCVCAATATRALSCARSHLYCDGCWSRLDKCALCREPLPSKDSPYAKNLVAEQVFEAIAAEYEIKDPAKKCQFSTYTTRSPQISTRKGQYQLSMMNRRTQYAEKYSSDPNIHTIRTETKSNLKTHNCQSHNIRTDSCSQTDGPSDVMHQTRCQMQSCHCQKLTDGAKCPMEIPRINLEIDDSSKCMLQHKLVARLRQACSLADLQNLQSCQLSKSMNNINSNEHSCSNGQHSNSVDNLVKNMSCDTPVFLLSPPPIYVLSCDHS